MGGGGMFLGATAPLLRSICNSATLPSKVTKLHFFLSFWFAVKYFIFWVTSLVENFWLSTTICICGLWIRLQTPDSESRLQTLNQTPNSQSRLQTLNPDSRLSIQTPDSESDSRLQTLNPDSRLSIRLWIQTPDSESRLQTLNPDSRLWVHKPELRDESRGCGTIRISHILFIICSFVANLKFQGNGTCRKSPN